jgi:hypothetical protein
MASDPFGNYIDLLHSCISDYEPQARKCHDQDHMDVLTDEIALEYERNSAELSKETWASRAHWEAEFAGQFQSVYGAVDQMIGMARAVHWLLITGFASAQTSPPQIVQYGVSLVFTRAISTAHEICALLRAGFAHGAMARWRTLYELSVVSGVLEIGNRGTVARYVNHRWILMAKHEVSDSELGITPAHPNNAHIKRQARKYVRRYGQEYAGTYGWAAEVTRRKLNQRKPQFYHLEKLVGEKRDPRYTYSNRAVHADSVGNLLMVSDEGLLHSGPSEVGIRSTAMATVVQLGNVIDALLSVWGQYPASIRIDLMRTLNTELRTTMLSEPANWEAPGQIGQNTSDTSETTSAT